MKGVKNCQFKNCCPPYTMSVTKQTEAGKCIVTGCIESRLHTCAAGRIVTTNENDKCR